MPRLLAGIKGTPGAAPTVDGITVRFTRRRYSNRTYTWVSALLDGTWTELVDPWPSIKVSDNEIRMAIARVKSGQTTHVDGTNGCTCDKPQLRCPAHDAIFTEEEL